MNQKVFKITLFTALVLVAVLGIMLLNTSKKLNQIEREKAANDLLQQEYLASKADFNAAFEGTANTNADSNSESEASNEQNVQQATGKITSNGNANKFPTNKSWENRLNHPLRSEYNSVITAQPTLGTVIEADTVHFQWALKNKNDKIFLGVLDYLNNEIFFEEVNASGYKLSARSKNLKDGVYYWILESETDVLHASKFILNRDKNKS